MSDPQKYETRFVRTPVRLVEEGTPQISGMIPYNSLSEDLGGFREILATGAFKPSLDSGAEIWALDNHNWEKRMAKRSKGTLVLTDTEAGLVVGIVPNATSWSKDVVAAIDDMEGMSFGFIVLDERWTNNDDGIIRQIISLDLREVSPVWQPAYSQSQVSVRALDQAKAMSFHTPNWIALQQNQLDLHR